MADEETQETPELDTTKDEEEIAVAELRTGDFFALIMDNLAQTGDQYQECEMTFERMRVRFRIYPTDVEILDGKELVH